jgi:hypothetical protein
MELLMIKIVYVVLNLIFLQNIMHIQKLISLSVGL